MSRRHERHDEYGQSWMIAGLLLDGPLTMEEIEKQLTGVLRRMGFFVDLISYRAEQSHFPKQVRANLDHMLEEKWVTLDDGRYALTDLGVEQAEKSRDESRWVGELIRERLFLPQTVSKVTLVTHLVLAALKLPAGLLSGSVGLLNDAIDTTIDGVSSLVVYGGIRTGRERLANIILVLLMLATGVFTAYQAVMRFIVPEPPEADWFTFVAVLVSAATCALLYVYQRYVGLKSDNLALIAQSVDSRNHVLVGLGVTASLVAVLLDFALLDTIVGAVIAALILKSAIELTIDTLGALGDEPADLSRYRMPLSGSHERMRRARLRNWYLYLIIKEDERQPDALLSRARSALDFGDNRTLQFYGLAEQPDADVLIDAAYHELLDQRLALLNEQGLLEPTPEGRRRIRRWI